MSQRNHTIGHAPKTPESQGLTAREAPIIRGSMNEMDTAVYNLGGSSQPYLSKLALQNTANAKVFEPVVVNTPIVTNSQPQYTGEENNPEMAERARQAAFAIHHSPSIAAAAVDNEGNEYVQKAA